MSFTDVFGVQTVPPSEYSLATYTIAANNTFYWPEQYSGTGLLLAKITRLDVTAPALELTLPPADETSVGQDILFSNIGASTVTIKDAAGGVVTTIGAGVSKYLYVFDNSTPAGSWYSLTFGAGSNSVDAAALAGFGLKAISSQLVTNVPNATLNANYTITASDRSKAFDITTGTITVSLPQASVVDDGFWVAIRNSSIGSADIEGYLAETINGGLTFTLGPNESALFYCNGASWITVGYGRDVNFVFSEYVVNAAAGNVTLSSSDVSGRMIRVSGTAVANFTVTLPTIDNIYFVIVESGMGGFTVTFKTAIGTGVTLSANQNVALYSDGTNVNFAVTTAAVSSIDLNDGSAVSPSLRFLLDADTGIFRVGANTLGIAANGAQVAQFDPLGLTGSVVFTPVGTIAATTVAGALAELDGDIQGHITDATDAHDASAISNTPAGGIAATDVQAALNELDTEKAPLASPVFTGNPTAPTPALGDDDTSIATTAFVMDAYADGFGGGGFGFKNVLINGDMRLAQAGTSFAAVATGAYTLDQWKYSKVGAMVHTVTQDTDVPTVAQAGRLIPFSLRLNLTTADNAIAAGDFCIIQQLIEGHFFLPIAQKSFTISFWVKATLAGTYCCHAVNSGSDRSYVGEFTINAGATWERKTVTMTASPTAGTWDYSTGVGLRFGITLASGTNFHTAAGSWQTGNFIATVNQVNGVATGATDFRFTDVQIEPGDEATPFDFRPFSVEEMLSQRYYEKSFAYATAPAQNAGREGALHVQAIQAGAATLLAQYSYKVPKRTEPSMTFYNPSAANAQARNENAGADATATATGSPAGEKYLIVAITTAAGTAAGNQFDVHWVADARL